MNKIVLTDSAFIKKLEMLGVALLILGAIGGVSAIAFDLKAFFYGYVLGFSYVLGITVTALFFSALQFLVNAGWSALVRRIAEMLTPMTYIIIIGFIPILIDVFFTHQLYHWAHEGVTVYGHESYDPVIAGKSWFLNPTFFAIRVVIYMVVWLLMYKVIVGNSFKQDDAGSDDSPTRKNKVLAAPFILLYALTLSAAGIDLVMALDAHWFSTMFGVYFFAGSFIATLSILTILTVKLREHGHLPQVTDEHYHDLGKLLFAFNVFWSYIAFSQYMLYWYANIPEETLFYIHRLQHGWEIFFYILIVFHFIVPFCILISQKAKRNPKVLVGVSVLLLVMHFVDLCWYVLPNADPTAGVNLSWPHISMFLFFFGLMLFWTARQFKTRNAVAVNDPYIGESIELVS